MNICPNCNFQNPDDIHICLNCATSLKKKCPKCSAEVPVGNRFCGQCGYRLTVTGSEAGENVPTSADIELQDRMLRNLRSKMPSALVAKLNQVSKELKGQRREVTILNVEISGFNEISEALDSETVYLASDEIKGLLAETIYKYEGTIDKNTGNGLVALFGIPLNHENDPERAVRAALEIQYAMGELKPHLTVRYRHDFQLQVGINTGSVIAGIYDDQRHMEYTVIGDTVQMASMLQRAAGAGNTLVSFSTYQRSRPIFDYESMPTLQLEDGTRIEKAFKPLGVRLIPGMVRGLPGLQVAMIGRSKQLELLIEQLIRVVRENSSRIVLCSGEAGIGKSRLVAEMTHHLPNTPVTIGRGTCASYMRITPYRVVADVLRSLLGMSELDPVNQQREVLRQRLEQLGLVRDDVFPYLLHVLGLLKSDPIMEVRIKLLEPAMLRRQTHFALRMFFITISRQSAVILVFDDLHWVDQASGEFLEYLCQSLEETPILLVMVARDFGIIDVTQEIKAAAGKHIHKPTEIQIQPLAESDAHLLVDQVIHEDSEDARALKNLITARAGGNPYYTEELIRFLMDHGGLVIQEGEWHVTAEAPEHINEVPGTLADIILARFDHLAEILKRILMRASVLGDTFSTKLLEAVAETDREALEAGLSELARRDFLLYTRLGSEDGFIFKHPMLQDTIYRTILKRDLQRLHTQVAQAIKAGEYWLPAERNQFLSHHLRESTNPEKAIPYLLVSARNASQHFANDTVAELYRQALMLMEQVETAAVEKLEAQVGLAKALKFTSELDEAARLLRKIVDEIPGGSEEQPEGDPALFQIQIEAVRELADILAREGNLDTAVSLLTQGLDLLGEHGKERHPNIFRRLIDRLAWVYFRQRNLDEAYNLVDLALLDTLTREAEDPITLASLYNTMGGIYWTRMRYDEAIESVEQSLAIYKDLHYQWGMANSLTNLGVLLFSTEKWDKAVRYFNQADTFRRDYGDDPERPVNLKNLGEVLIDIGDFPNAREKLETCKAISQRLGLDIALADAELGLCRLNMLEGNRVDAREHLDTAKGLFGPSDEINDRSAHYFFLQAYLALMEGEIEAAKVAAEESLRIAQHSGMADKQVEALRVLGMVYGRMMEFDQAETYIYDSIELAQKNNDRFNEAKGRYELGLYYLQRGRQEAGQQGVYGKQAERSLSAAIRIFESLGAKYDLQIAKNALSEISSLATQEDEMEGVVRGKGVELAEGEGGARQGELPDGEWYQATVFSVLLSQRQGMDEEYILETVAFLLPPLKELIRDNGGEIVEQQQGITAIFGAPVSHEDDAERAVETVMEIVNFYNELNKETELPINMQIGMTMGRIVASKNTKESDQIYLATGEAIQMSYRMAEACPSGRAWASQGVQNLTFFRFEYSRVTPRSTDVLPGEKVYQLEGLREQILPVRGLMGLKSPFIGRQNELDAMWQMSTVLEGEAGGIIWIDGEAGIGKSRLMREFSEKVVQGGPLVLKGACTTRRSDFAFSLFSDLLFNAFEIQHNYTSNQINTVIDEKLGSWTTSAAEIRPYLQLLLGVHPSGTMGERIAYMEPEQLRQQTFVAIHRLFSSIAVIKPLVLILDDLQWIDSISADLLLYLSHLVVSHRILFVCAERKKETSPFNHVLVRTRTMHADRYIQLSIRPLTIEECQRLLGEFLSSAEIPASILTLIVQQSGGNPYFIEEFVRLLMEKDYLRLVRGKLISNRALQEDHLVVPTSLESVIRARVDSLDTTSRQLLQVAAVIGHRFERALLEQVSEQPGTEQTITRLHDRGMLNPTTEAEQWEFSHPLIEVIVYNTVLRAQRRIFHERTATALEGKWRGSEADHAEDLAYHFGKAEVHDQALHYLTIAGERAAARHANDVAVNFFEQAAELLTTVANVGEEARWRIISGMGEVYQFIGNYDASVTVLQSGLDLVGSQKLTASQRAGLYRRLGDTAHKKADQEQAIIYLEKALEILGEPEDTQGEVEAALIYSRLGWCLFLQSDLEPAKEAVMRSKYYAAKANNLSALAMTENRLGGILFREGDLEQAMQQTRTAMSYCQEIGYSWGVAAGLSNLGILESVAGNWQAAYNSIKRSLILRQEMGDVDGVAITNHNLGFLARNQGKLDEAERFFRDSLSVSKPYQMNYNAANSFIHLAQTLLQQGRVVEAVESLKQGNQLAEEVNAPDLVIEAYCVQAEIHLAQGQTAESKRCVQKAEQMGQEIGISTLLATAKRLMAASLLQEGDRLGAQATIGDAFQLLDDSQDQLEFGRLHAQAMMIAKAGNQPEAEVFHRETAEMVFKRLGAARDLELLNGEDG